MPKLATKIMNAILDDVTDRKGWRHEWDDFDEDVQQEIRETWIAIIDDILSQEKIA